MWEVPGSIPSQGPHHTKGFIKMVPVVWHSRSKREILAKIGTKDVMDKIWDRKSFEVGGHWRCGGDEKRMTTQN